VDECKPLTGDSGFRLDLSLVERARKIQVSMAKAKVGRCRLT